MNPRHILQRYLLTGLAICAWLPVLSEETSTYKFMVGCGSRGSESNLHVYSFNPADTTVMRLYSVPVADASYLNPDPSGNIVAVTERGTEDSFLSLLQENKSSGKFEVVGKSSVKSASPCYVSVSPDARYAVTANYVGGDISVIPVSPSGKLGNCAVRMPFGGRGPVEGRQDRSHPHCAVFTKDGTEMLVSNLGTDKIYVFDVTGKERDGYVKLKTDVRFPAGHGPRHIVFSEGGDMAYVINEISDCVTVLKRENGKWGIVQDLLADEDGGHGAGDIHLSPDGKYLYVSLRLKNDGLVTFSVDPATGLLTKTGHTPTGKHPRNFALTPEGDFVFLAARDDNQIELYSVDKISGKLNDTGKRIEVEMPLCVKFLKK